MFVTERPMNRLSSKKRARLDIHSLSNEETDREEQHRRRVIKENWAHPKSFTCFPEAVGSTSWSTPSWDVTKGLGPLPEISSLDTGASESTHERASAPVDSSLPEVKKPSAQPTASREDNESFVGYDKNTVKSEQPKGTLLPNCSELQPPVGRSDAESSETYAFDAVKGNCMFRDDQGSCDSGSDGDDTLLQQARDGRSQGGKKRSRAWDIMFKRLAEYKEEHGDCMVPQKYKEDPQLGRWVMNQRKIVARSMNRTTPIASKSSTRLVSFGDRGWT